MEKAANYYPEFNRRNKLNKQGKAGIDIIITHKGKRKIFSTGIYIKPADWDKKKRKIKRSNPNSVRFNIQIDELIKEFQKIEYNCILQGNTFNLDLLDNKQEYEISFTEFFLNEIKTRKDIKESSLKSNLIAYKSFLEFAGNISFEKLTYKLISDYDIFLHNKGYSDYTIRTRHKVLKTYINIAINKKLLNINDYPYRNFKLKDVKSKRIALSFNELSRLEKLKLNSFELELAKDLFLFSSYTGLRFEDVLELNDEHVIKQKNLTEIRKIINKTQKEIRLPISLLFKGKALNIINKYKESGYNIFPKRYNQSINRNLKVIAHLINYKYPLSFHIARHTFGSRLAELQPDPYIIKELMGHADIKTSMIYIKTSSNVLEKKVRNINWDF